MYILPNDIINLYGVGCFEKIASYQNLFKAKLPILKSVLLHYNEVINLNDCSLEKIKKHLHSQECMLRYIYVGTCCKVKNGGKIVKINKDELCRELDCNTMLWLLEPKNRFENLFCINTIVNKSLGCVHMEILCRGFDVSDINKGKISPHEIIELPYPIEKGYYGEWWKWIKIYKCTNEVYKKSVICRVRRLREFGVMNIIDNNFFYPEVRLLPFDILETMLAFLERLDEIYYNENEITVSCSLDKERNFIFWDVQTPLGKRKAYIGC